jgi:pyruvate-formate lyase
VANSLLAIRKLVYEDRSVTMSQLVEALRSNFEGTEGLRSRCLQLPKYGNDQEDVDALAADVADHVFSHTLQQRIWNGDGYYAFCASGGGMHIAFGKTTGATPDGRLAGTPLANSMGAMQGTDTNGPSALLNSVAKLPLWKCVGTPVVNFSVQPQLLKCGQRQALVTLIQTFFRLGGMQLQINTVDKDTLREAMKHPEAHSSLIVRVSGYSARFTDLPVALQEEIISRTVH